MTDASIESARFVEWARDSRVPLANVSESGKDLARLAKMMGNAKIVGISEGVHLAREPLEFRNRVFEYLVRENGFTAIAIESGLIEGRVVHDYVRGEPGNLSAVLAQGIGWTFDRLPQNRQLIQWMREYNADPHRTRKLNFYGFDVPGSPGNPGVTRGPDVALIEAVKYLATVDGAAAAAFNVRLKSLVKNLRFDLQRAADAPGYDRFTSEERDQLTAIIADLVVLLEECEGAYSAVSTATDYEWGYRSAVGARQIDAWLRQMPLGWQPSPGPVQFPSEATRFLAGALAVRDRAQADNLEWIIRQEGDGGKILVYGHVGHLSASPIRMNAFIPGDAEPCPHDTAGTYLRRRLGGQYLAVGNLIAAGEIGYAGYKQTLPEALPESMEAMGARVGVPSFLLDLRSAPAAVAAWLMQEHALGQGPAVLKLEPGNAFDILFYLDRVTPACGGD